MRNQRTKRYWLTHCMSLTRREIVPTILYRYRIVQNAKCLLSCILTLEARAELPAVSYIFAPFCPIFLAAIGCFLQVFVAYSTLLSNNCLQKKTDWAFERHRYFSPFAHFYLSDLCKVQ